MTDWSFWLELMSRPGVCARPVRSIDGTPSLIDAEILSGTRTRKEFERLRELLAGLTRLVEPDGIWELVAEARYGLARRGFQCAVVDLIIALTATHAGHALLARDRDFKLIRTTLDFDLQLV